MADDPRIDGAVARLMKTHPSWFKRLTTIRNRNWAHPGHDAALYAARTIAEAAVRGADAADPLRVLLADEDRALDLIANAIYGVDGNSGPAPLRFAFPVLAALREVSGL